MNGAVQYCPGVKNYMQACSDDIKTGRLTRKIWKIKSRWLHAAWRLEQYGFLATMRFAIFKALRATGINAKTKPVEPAGESIPLNLQPGEMVEVRSEQEILRTLDETGRNRGLLFMPCMRKFCGQKMRVYKRLERILLESTGESRKLKDTVLLEGAICDGAEFGGCDRSCFHYWREAWLKRSERSV